VRIAVVIPTLEEADRVEQAIESARAPGVEIIVADGGSRDTTRARAEAAGARVVTAPRGRARQLAAGASATGAETILFLHADTRLPPGWAPAVGAAFAEPRVVGGAFRFRFAEAGLALRVVEWGVRVRLALGGPPYGDQALFVRRAELDAIGGVPQVPILEDLELVRALRRRGRLVLLPLAAVTSARRYLERGVLRTVTRNTGALLAFALGLDHARVAAWYGR
jgi:rSAM/selenodomain-associated transferase 2